MRRDRGKVAEIARAVMERMKAHNPNLEVHHIFGREGRFLACRHFMRPLSGDDHRGKGYGYRLERIRDEMRDDYLSMKQANWHNREHATCWWKDCPINSECPLYEEV